MTLIRHSLLFIFGALVATIMFILIGRVQISGDFAANLAGATIGGMISVGLALFMFERERRGAKSEAEQLASQQRVESIRQALRYVRSIKECIQGGYAFNINNSQRIRGAILQSAAITRKALEDVTLSDFPLRLSMEDAASIGNTTAALLIAKLDEAQLQDANLTLPQAKQICDDAVKSLDALMEDYKALRAVPAL